MQNAMASIIIKRSGENKLELSDRKIRLSAFMSLDFLVTLIFILILDDED